MKITTVWGKAAGATALFLSLAGALSCSKIQNGGDVTEHLDDEYVLVTLWSESADWSGDYALVKKNDASTALVFDCLNESRGEAAEEEIAIYDGVIFGEDADESKTVLIREGDYYRLCKQDVGYIGFDKTAGGFVSSLTSDSSDPYLWEVLISDGDEAIKLCPKTSDKCIGWDNASGSFVIGDSLEAVYFYRRVLSTGVTIDPETDPDKDPDTDPDNPDKDTDPTPEPDPTPTPTPTGAKYGWYELPVINYSESGDYLIDNTDNTLYYAHHLCAGGEKGPNGRTARNYTVCYSAEEHCPVWVAAPRHQMYQTKGCNRTNAYGKDPDIPSDIQYNSKSTGGGCNKGHMLGSAERLCSSATNRQVFYYTNIAPQYSGSFNTGGGAWNNLESFVDGQVCSDTLYEVIGCYFKQYKDSYGNVGEPTKISFGGRKDVTRPSMFYYVLLRTKSGNSGKALSQCSTSDLKCVAFVLCHEMDKGHKPQAKDMMSVSDLEKLTGFTYFPNVPQAPKTTFNASDWGL